MTDGVRMVGRESRGTLAFTIDDLRAAYESGQSRGDDVPFWEWFNLNQRRPAVIPEMVTGQNH